MNRERMKHLGDHALVADVSGQPNNASVADKGVPGPHLSESIPASSTCLSVAR